MHRISTEKKFKYKASICVNFSADSARILLFFLIVFSILASDTYLAL